MRINKKLLQCIGGMWILIFHLWIPITGSAVEVFVQRIGYVGVDIFFYAAAYSMAGSMNSILPGVYKAFVLNRLWVVYVPFAVFTLLAALIRHWPLLRTVKILCGAELLEKGGGSFLWFLPAIMLVYLLLPPVLFYAGKRTPVVLLLIWLVLGCLFEFILGYEELFILVNRIPVIAAGCAVRQLEERKEQKEQEKKGHKEKSRAEWSARAAILCGYLLLMAAGLILLKRWGAEVKLHAPFREFFYVFGILPVLALSGISRLIPENKAMRVTAAATLELYALQMIFGTKLVSALYRLSGSKALTDLLTIILLWGVSLLLAGIDARRLRLPIGKTKTRL